MKPAEAPLPPVLANMVLVGLVLAYEQAGTTAAFWLLRQVHAQERLSHACRPAQARAGHAEALGGDRPLQRADDVRERDTMEQVRVPISELKAYLAEKLAY